MAVWGQSGLAEASLEQLLDIQVTTVSKKEQKLARTAAAVFVLGAEEIRRSGALTLPDLLRLVPGVQVAQIDANAWAIAIRGFNSRYSNKVLVLVDGRAVYNAAFSGVYWDQVDVPVEDIERIEVIRGPGATVWGANAVNGVINVITRPAKATPGGLATAAVGSGPERRDYCVMAARRAPAARTGRLPGIRVLGTGNWRTGSPAPTGGRACTVDFVRTGNWGGGMGSRYKATGSRNRGSQSRSSAFLDGTGLRSLSKICSVDGGNLLARWKHASVGGAETSVQAYYDTYRRLDLGTE